MFEDEFADDQGNILDGMEDKLKQEIQAYKDGGLKGALDDWGSSSSAKPTRRTRKAPARPSLGLHENSQAGPSHASGEASPRKSDEWKDVLGDENEDGNDAIQKEASAEGTAVTPVNLDIEPPTSSQSSAAGPSSSSASRSAAPPTTKHIRDRPTRKTVFVHPSRPVGAGRRRDSVRRALFTSGKRMGPRSSNHQHTASQDEEALSSSASTTSSSSPARSTADLPSSLTQSLPQGDGAARVRGRAHDIRSSDRGGPSSRQSSLHPPTPVGSRAGSPGSRIRFADEQPSRPSTPSSPMSGSTGLVKSRSRSNMFQSGQNPVSGPESGSRNSSPRPFVEASSKDDRSGL